jgi:hypothetical protein
MNTKRDVQEVVNEMYTSWFEQIERTKSVTSI